MAQKNQVTKFVPVEKVSSGVVTPQSGNAKKVIVQNASDQNFAPQWAGENPNLYGAFGAGKELYEQAIAPSLKGAGLAVGTLTGGIPGAGLLYGIMNRLTEMGQRGIDKLEGKKLPNLSIVGELKKSATDVAEGMSNELGGKLLSAGIPLAAKGIGKVGSQVVGRLTGTGKTAIKEAYKAGASTTKTMFEKALKGKMTGEEVVGIAKNALNRIKDQRAMDYQASLAKITGSSPAIPGQTVSAQKIDIKPIGKKFYDLLNQYGIKGSTGPNGELVFDTSRVAMGKKGIRDIKEVIKKMSEWGQDPEDFTAKGLDTLKRQLGDFYSDSSQARQFVTSLKNSVKDTITKAVPEYGKMTAKYAEATQLIKDIESNLMMRKQGMSGRIVSDQTLRRIMSAMKDNFELRGELVGILGNRGGEDVMGAIAGHTMKSWVPMGLAGTGPAIVGNAALAKFVSPVFWPVVAMSSPRVAAQFVKTLGKYSTELSGMAQAAGRTAIQKTLDKPKVDPLGIR